MPRSLPDFARHRDAGLDLAAYGLLFDYAKNA
jgi:hypothetical protein